MKEKTIHITDQNHDVLTALKTKDETYNEIITKIIEFYVEAMRIDQEKEKHIALKDEECRDYDPFG